MCAVTTWGLPFLLKGSATLHQHLSPLWTGSSDSPGEELTQRTWSGTAVGQYGCSTTKVVTEFISWKGPFLCPTQFLAHVISFICGSISLGSPMTSACNSSCSTTVKLSVSWDSMLREKQLQDTRIPSYPAAAPPQASHRHLFSDLGASELLSRSPWQTHLWDVEIDSGLTTGNSTSQGENTEHRNGNDTVTE